MQSDPDLTSNFLLHGCQVECLCIISHSSITLSLPFLPGSLHKSRRPTHPHRQSKLNSKHSSLNHGGILFFIAGILSHQYIGNYHNRGHVNSSSPGMDAPPHREPSPRGGGVSRPALWGGEHPNSLCNIYSQDIPKGRRGTFQQDVRGHSNRMPCNVLFLHFHLIFVPPAYI